MDKREKQKSRFDLQPDLVGETLLLRPLRQGDFEELYLVASDPLIWEQHPEPLRYQQRVFESWFENAMASGGALMVYDKILHKCIGSSRYYDFSAAKHEVTIGYTFLAKGYWGGASNAELKRLMLQHAFQWVETVLFFIGQNNIRSRKAIEKIGAVYSHEVPNENENSQHDAVCYKIQSN